MTEPGSRQPGDDVDVEPDATATLAAARSADRTITLTDGVVAIAMTLLALDLKPAVGAGETSHQLAGYLGRNAGQYIAFALAFGLIAQYWLAHHRTMNRVVRTSPALMQSTLLFLFGITLLPLTTYLQGDLTNALATQIFSANVALVSLAVGLIGEVVRRQHLEDYRESRDARLRREVRSVVTVLIPILVAGLAPTLGGHASFLFFLFLAASLPGRLAVAIRHRGAPPAS